jgi:hypothetical protein
MPILRDDVATIPPTVIYSWISVATAASMGGKCQPIEVGVPGMTRDTDTCADAGTVKALRDAR